MYRQLAGVNLYKQTSMTSPFINFPALRRCQRDFLRFPAESAKTKCRPLIRWKNSLQSESYIGNYGKTRLFRFRQYSSDPPALRFIRFITINILIKTSYYLPKPPLKCPNFQVNLRAFFVETWDLGTTVAVRVTLSWLRVQYIMYLISCSSIHSIHLETEQF